MISPGFAFIYSSSFPLRRAGLGSGDDLRRVRKKTFARRDRFDFRITLMTLRQTANFFNPINAESTVQSFCRKYFVLPVGQIIFKPSRRLAPLNEGRFAIVTDVGRGMRWTRRRRKTSGASADGKVVWS